MNDNSLVRCIIGPVGSGKSMGCIMELLRRACAQQPYNGIRYTRFALVRNTSQQLRQTVLSDVQQYLGPIVHYKVTDSTIQIRVGMPDGTYLHSDWILLPLDTKEDVRRLLSMQLTGSWINEMREVPIDVISGLLGRLGRYPSKAMGGPTWFGLIGDTNPWDTDSPYHEQFVLSPNPKWKLYHQPSGIGPDAENVENLPPGYYDNLSDGHDIEWQQVHVESMWGVSNAGQAVFRKSFHAPTHVRDMKLVVNPQRPIMIGMDFGRTPCAVIGQIDNYGRAIIMKEIVTEGMGLVKMVQEYLKPALYQEPFNGRRFFIVGDPAGGHKSQATELSLFDELKREGFQAYPASTNAIDPRLLAVEKLFGSHLAGEPAIQISREGCPILIQSLGNKYRYRKKRDGAFEDLPEKLHPWSDVCFVAGTPVATPSGMRHVEDLKTGDAILAPSGRAVIEATGVRQVRTTVEVVLTDGRVIRCTPEHPFALDGRWQPAHMLQKGDILENIKCAEYLEKTSKTFLETDTIEMVKINTTGVKLRIAVSYGSRLMGLLRRAMKFIIKTVTHSTT